MGICSNAYRRRKKMNRKPIILIVSFLILTFAASVFAQETVTPEDSAKFIGQQKTVCGKVASAHYATRSKGSLPLPQSSWALPGLV